MASVFVLSLSRRGLNFSHEIYMSMRFIESYKSVLLVFTFHIFLVRSTSSD